MFITRLGSRLLQTVYNNSKIIRAGCKFGKKVAEPVIDMKNIYKQNKHAGTGKVVKAIFKEKGVCAPVLTLAGAVAGVPVPAPFASLFCASLGYQAGKHIDTSAKLIYKMATKMVAK